MSEMPGNIWFYILHEHLMIIEKKAIVEVYCSLIYLHFTDRKLKWTEVLPILICCWFIGWAVLWMLFELIFGVIRCPGWTVWGNCGWEFGWNHITGKLSTSVRFCVCERLGHCGGERDVPRAALEDDALSAGHLQDQWWHDRLPRVVQRARHQRTQHGRKNSTLSYWAGDRWWSQKYLCLIITFRTNLRTL